VERHCWATVSSPDVSDTDLEVLVAVSCSSVSFCMATGYSVDAQGYMQTLMEEWNGAAWSIVASQMLARTIRTSRR